ncbi:hypothetical protein I9W82_001420 [Candida metapsilosis]|uniref:Hyphally-regulated cell wall protein N-terminal domain-containing protein n=1 Tax=Candida metapsilosis TaxID=273372 RepID=A0A8H7ZL66_9ASCO|nr:hypothetical protein I9W82_001420 [Candida metapsilosis]
MKLVKFISTLAFAAYVAAELTQYQFFVESDNEDINGHGIYYHNEGSVINYGFISNDTDTSSASIVTYDTDTQEFFQQITPQSKYVITNTNSVFQLSGQGEALKAPLGASGEIYFGSGVKLYAAKSYGDPVGYSDFNYGVLTRVVENGISLTIIAKEYEPA